MLILARIASIRRLDCRFLWIPRCGLGYPEATQIGLRFW